MFKTELEAAEEEAKQAKREERNAKARKKREQKAKKKYRPKLPQNKIQIIKNPEKDKGNWMESYRSPPKGASVGWWPHPVKALFLGGCGRGKTNLIKNSFLQHQGGRGKPYKELYIITCSDMCSEYDDLEYTGLLTEIPDADFFSGKEKTCVILDDFEMSNLSSSDKRKLSTLFRYVATHRNVSIFCGFQSAFDTPPIIRKCSDVFVIYKPNNRQEVDTLANRLNLESRDLRYIFKHICNGVYDALCVNNIPGAPYRLTKNLHTPIEMEDESDEE
jgi:hypothetical protein